MALRKEQASHHLFQSCERSSAWPAGALASHKERKISSVVSRSQRLDFCTDNLWDTVCFSPGRLMEKWRTYTQHRPGSGHLRQVPDVWIDL